MWKSPIVSRSLLTLLLITSSLAVVTQPAEAAEYKVALQEESIQVSLSVNFRQNITSLITSFSLPQIEGTLSGGNATEGIRVVQAALQERIPSATVEDLRLEASTSPWSNVTDSQWFNITMTFRLLGVVQDRGDVLAADMAWKSFVVGEDILLGDSSLNAIGDKYLTTLPPDIAGPPNPLASLSFTVDGFIASEETLFETVRKVKALDFSAFQEPLSEWETSLDLDTASTFWKKDPGTRTAFSIIFSLSEPSGLPIPRPGATVVIDYVLESHTVAEIRVQGIAFAKEDTVTFESEVAAGLPLLTGIILSPIAVLLASILVEKKLLSPSRGRMRRGRTLR